MLLTSASKLLQKTGQFSNYIYLSCSCTFPELTAMAPMLWLLAHSPWGAMPGGAGGLCRGEKSRGFISTASSVLPIPVTLPVLGSVSHFGLLSGVIFMPRPGV